MAASVDFEEQLEIPLNLQTLEDFRQWALSDSFPDRGRIDFIAGRIEVDMSPEEIYCHGTLKVELIRVLSQRVKLTRQGDLFSDRTRISSSTADLSAEPDIVFLSHQAISEGRVRLVPKSSGEPGRYVELEGAPDLIVEIVSDSSVRKDTRRLPVAYYTAGVREFWLVDARGDELLFQIHGCGKDKFEPVQPDEKGFQHSSVFDCRYRLERTWEETGRWEFDFLEKNQ